MATQDPTLLKIQKSLPNYFSYFKADNILAISEDKMQLPFCFLIKDSDYKKEVLLSLAVDYPNSINVANICVVAGEVSKVGITQPFYISMTDGHTYIDDEAFDRWDLECIDMSNVQPISGAIN